MFFSPNLHILLLLIFVLSIESFPSTHSPVNSISKFYDITKMNVLESMQTEVAVATGKDCEFRSSKSGWGGGGGASVGSIVNQIDGTKYFYKSSSLSKFDMLKAEFEGIKAMYETNTIKVPEPICYGTSENKAFVVFEHLDMGGRGSMSQMGEALAAMHRISNPDGKFGFHIDNTCGATHQPNSWEDTWADFYDKHRLNYMLERCENMGASFNNKKELRAKVYDILSAHNPEPSLVHGDLWSGNKGFCNGEPVIFDPATYYGDREVDIAMSHLFGGFGVDFYSSYESVWPLSPGFEQRKVIYNLYHILNHYVLFGGGYLYEAKSMISEIMDF